MPQQNDIKPIEPALEAWLTTIVSDTTLNYGDTIRPVRAERYQGGKQPLLDAMLGKAAGQSVVTIQVGATLAEGGMGVVKLARQESLGRTVVIKTMREGYDHTLIDHVLREAWATGALEHPNIVPVHDVRIDESGAPVIVLKRIEGDSWAALMHDHERLQALFGVDDPLQWNLSILGQVCQAIRYAHKRGILHRDLKPDNIMIGEFGEVYVVDWGIALSLGLDPENPLALASEQKMMAGTPCYMAPEMLGESGLDERTDIYLLGALLCEILTGAPPHRTTNLQDLLTDIRQAEPTLPRHLSPMLTTIVKRAMARDPDNRFPLANDFTTALQHYEQTRHSEKLAIEAGQRHQDLRQLLSTQSAESGAVDRLFGAVRFGYETAIQAWPGNQQAIDALDEARVLMVHYELAEGYPKTALAHLSTVSQPPPALVAQVTQAVAGRNKERDELAGFREKTNVAIGLRARATLAGVCGLTWTVVPIVGSSISADFFNVSYLRLALIIVGFWIGTTLMWLWARESMLKTEINRRLTFSLMTVFPIQLVMLLGAYTMSVPTAQAEVLLLLIWMGVAAGAAATVDRRLSAVSAAYAVGFVVSARHPEYRYLAMSASNFVYLLIGLFIWRRPKSSTSDQAHLRN